MGELGWWLATFLVGLLAYVGTLVAVVSAFRAMNKTARHENRKLKRGRSDAPRRESVTAGR
jgi:hypothetical protein